MCFPSTPSAPDPDKAARKAATEATARANAQLVADQRRRRGQSNLLAGGAADETLGAGAGAGGAAGARMAANVLGGGRVLYDSVTGRSAGAGSPGSPGNGRNTSRMVN